MAIAAAALTQSRRIVSPQFSLLWAGACAFYLSFYLLLPTLPLYARDLGIPESRIGLIIGFFALSSMIVKPVAGWAADRYGRRPLMLVGAALFLASSLLYPWSRSVAALLVVRLLHGAGMGLYPTGSAATVADIAPAARRGEAMGLWGAAASIALATGPLAGVEISTRLGFPPLFGLSAVIALGALIMVPAIRETLPARTTAPFTLESLMSGAVLHPCLVVFCLMATYGLQVSFLPIHAQAQGTNPGLFFLVLALVVALVRGAAGRLSDRVGRAPVAAAGLGLTTASLAVLAMAGGPWPLALAGLLYGLGFGAAQPVLMAWAVDLVPAVDRGRAMGTFYAALELGISVGAIGSGYMAARMGFPAVFAAGAALSLAGAAIAVTRRHR
jgi:MFS family permease